MTTVSPDTAMATAVAFLHLAQAQPSSPAGLAGLTMVVIGVVIVAFVTAFVRAVRALSVMMAAFMHVAAGMTSVMLTVTVLAVIFGYVLLHH
jgi:hypothetical protein